jgi:hypothetical protein
MICYGPSRLSEIGLKNSHTSIPFSLKERVKRPPLLRCAARTERHQATDRYIAENPDRRADYGFQRQALRLEGGSEGAGDLQHHPPRRQPHLDLRHCRHHRRLGPAGKGALLISNYDYMDQERVRDKGTVDRILVRIKDPARAT